MQSKISNHQFTQKVADGVRKSVQKMIERSKLLDESIVISSDGKIRTVKARDLK